MTDTKLNTISLILIILICVCFIVIAILSIYIESLKAKYYRKLIKHNKKIEKEQFIKAPPSSIELAEKYLDSYENPIILSDKKVQVKIPEENKESVFHLKLMHLYDTREDVYQLKINQEVSQEMEDRIAFGLVPSREREIFISSYDFEKLKNIYRDSIEIEERDMDDKQRV